MSVNSLSKATHNAPESQGTVSAGVNDYCAKPSIYSAFNSASTSYIKKDLLLNSRLWHGVPKLTEDQIQAFEAAYTGHQFFFMFKLPPFLTTGKFNNSECPEHKSALILKTIVEKCITRFDGAQALTLQEGVVDDQDGRTLTFPTGVIKPQQGFTMTLHEFDGLPLRNAIETFINGVADKASQHGHYYGNLGIPGGWCLKNHSWGLLKVIVDPSWTEIYDAIAFINAFPREVPFDQYDNFDKGQSQIIDNISISWAANEMRGPIVNKIAEVYMNEKILSMVETSVYNSLRLDPNIPGITYNEKSESAGNYIPSDKNIIRQGSLADFSVKS